MDRKKLFSQSVAAGQVFLVSNVIYSLASIPLALSYLSVAEFGLWSVVMQVANFLLLLDAGFSSGAGRLLIDVKDHRPCKAYGRLFVSTLVILLCAASLALLLGLAMAENLVHWMRVPADLGRPAFTLIAGQIIIAALTLPARTIGGCLVAHGRIDLLNVAFTIAMFTSLAAMWVAFRAGAGVYSLLWANGASAVYTVVATFVYASKRGFLPARAEWGPPEWADFTKVLHLSHNIFLNQIGGMILNVSQAILLGRFAGLETVGVWSVGSKLYQLILQATDKLVQSAGPICAEMWARGEISRFDHRFAQLKRLTLLAGSMGAAFLIAFNSQFIFVWTNNRVAWNEPYNYLLALLFAVRSFTTMESAPIIASKAYQSYRFIPLVEAFAFVGLATMLIPSYGIMGLLLSALAAAISITMPYVIYRERARVGAGSSRRSLGLCFLIAGCLPVATAWWATRVVAAQIDLWAGVGATALIVLTSCLPILWMTWRSFPRWSAWT